MAAAAGSFTVAARAHSTSPIKSRPSMARVTPASSKPTINASLCPEAMKLKSASGLSTPSHSASPGSVPNRRDRRGRETIIRSTPIISMNRNTRTWTTRAPPETLAAARVTVTKSGP